MLAFLGLGLGLVFIAFCILLALEKVDDNA